MIFSLLLRSPVKFVGGDCWPRKPTLIGCPSLLALGCAAEQPMEVLTSEQMDTSSSGGTSEASAPLPIRHPSGINAGPYKKQAYPMNSKRPEHLRMNLWHPAWLRTLGLLTLPSTFYYFLSKRLVDFFFFFLNIDWHCQCWSPALPTAPSESFWLSVACSTCCR